MLRALICGKMMAALVLATVLASAPARAAEKISAQEAEAMAAKAIDYLRTKGQKENGAFSPNTGSAVTSLVTTALLKQGRTPDDPMVAKALKYIETFVREDGGIHAPDSKQINYETSIGIMCLAEANKDGR